MYSKFAYIGASVFLALLFVVYGFFAFGKYTSNKKELADYDTVIQQFEQANVKFQKLLKEEKAFQNALKAERENATFTPFIVDSIGIIDSCYC